MLQQLYAAAAVAEAVAAAAVSATETVQGEVRGRFFPVLHVGRNQVRVLSTQIVATKMVLGTIR